MTPSLFVGSWRDRYAVLVQEFRPTGKPVGRQFMQSKHRLIRNKRTIKTWAAQNGRIHPQRAVSGGGVCPSEFPNQQGTRTLLQLDNSRRKKEAMSVKLDSRCVHSETDIQSSRRVGGEGLKKIHFGNGSVRVLEVGMNKKWRIILRWPPLYSVGGWEESYAVLVQEFRSTGKPVERQFM